MMSVLVGIQQAKVCLIHFLFGFYDRRNHVHLLGATAIDALSVGYRTILVDDCCRGVDLADIEKTKQTVISSNGILANSAEV